MKFVRLLQRLAPRKSFPNQTEQQKTGRSGERTAEQFLRREKGFRILVRNWRWEKDEIDLVCLDRGVLVFVEVKTRTAAALVPGYYAVDRRKKEALRRVCSRYLKQVREKPRTFRFDIIEVSVQPGGEKKVLHFENIPLFPKDYHWRA